MSRLTQRLILSLVAPVAALTLAAQSVVPPAAPPPPPAPAAPAAAPMAAPAAAPAAAPTAPAAAPVVAAPATASTAAKAQPSVLQQRVIAYLLKGISLTPEQHEKLEQLAQKHREMRLAFGEPTADSTAMAARVKIVRDQMAESRSVLTGEQQKIYDRNMAELREIFTP